jgi:hypothetical protein
MHGVELQQVRCGLGHSKVIESHYVELVRTLEGDAERQAPCSIVLFVADV